MSNSESTRRNLKFNPLLMAHVHRVMTRNTPGEYNKKKRGGARLLPRRRTKHTTTLQSLLNHTDTKINSESRHLTKNKENVESRAIHRHVRPLVTLKTRSGPKAAQQHATQPCNQTRPRRASPVAQLNHATLCGNAPKGAKTASSEITELPLFPFSIAKDYWLGWGEVVATILDMACLLN